MKGLFFFGSMFTIVAGFDWKNAFKGDVTIRLMNVITGQYILNEHRNRDHIVFDAISPVIRIKQEMLGLGLVPKERIDDIRLFKSVSDYKSGIQMDYRRTLQHYDINEGGRATIIVDISSEKVEKDDGAGPSKRTKTTEAKSKSQAKRKSKAKRTKTVIEENDDDTARKPAKRARRPKATQATSKTRAKRTRTRPTRGEKRKESTKMARKTKGIRTTKQADGLLSRLEEFF